MAAGTIAGAMCVCERRSKQRENRGVLVVCWHCDQVMPVAGDEPVATRQETRTKT